jgi:hypothetical protein
MGGAAASPMRREKSDRPLARLLGRGGVVGTAVVAVEAMIRGIDVHLDFGVCLFECFHARHRDVFVALTEVRQDGHLRSSRDFVRSGHATAVIRHRGRQALEFARGAPSEQPAPAIPDDADLAGLRGVVDRGLDVSQHPGRGQRFDGRLQRHAGAHVVGRIAELHAGLDAVESGRRHREVSVRRVAIGDRADVRVDAEYFLDDDDASLGTAGGLRDISGEYEAVGCLEVDRCAHVMISWRLRICCNGETKHAL